MKDVYYDVSDFKWDKESRTFSSSFKNLIRKDYFGLPIIGDFQMSKRQFYIRNYETGNQMRFRFIGEYNLTFGFYKFSSEEMDKGKIYCNIYNFN
jgi:hypothetical protein